jgi:hypothetical protein
MTVHQSTPPPFRARLIFLPRKPLQGGGAILGLVDGRRHPAREGLLGLCHAGAIALGVAGVGERQLGAKASTEKNTRRFRFAHLSAELLSRSCAELEEQGAEIFGELKREHVATVHWASFSQSGGQCRIRGFEYIRKPLTRIAEAVRGARHG